MAKSYYGKSGGHLPPDKSSGAYGPMSLADYANVTNAMTATRDPSSGAFNPNVTPQRGALVPYKPDNRSNYAKTGKLPVTLDLTASKGGRRDSLGIFQKLRKANPFAPMAKLWDLAEALSRLSGIQLDAIFGGGQAGPTQDYAGYTQIQNCGAGGSYGPVGGAHACGFRASAEPIPVSGPTTDGVDWKFSIIKSTHSSPGYHTYDGDQVWTRPAAGETTAPGWNPNATGSPSTVAPLNQPGPHLTGPQIKARDANPWAQPLSQRGPAPPAPPAKPQLTEAKWEPPQKGTKERKLVTQKPILKAISTAYTALTEVKDFIDAMHKALPKKLQKGKRPQEKLADLYGNLDKIDPVEAFKNLLENHLKDKIVGGLAGNAGRKMREAREAAGLGQTGIGTNPALGPHFR